MLKYFFKQKTYIVIILILIIVEPSINSWMNFWLQRLFNTAKVGANSIIIVRMLTMGFLVWMSKRIIVFTSSILQLRFTCNIKYNIKKDIFAKLFEMNASEANNRASSGEYISIFTNDISLLETRYIDRVIQLIANVISILILGASFLALDIKLAIPILCFGVTTLFIPAIASKILNAKSYEYSKRISRFTQKTKEFFSAYTTIKNYAIEKQIKEGFDRENTKTEDTRFDSDTSLSIANNIGSMLAWFMQLIAIGIGLIYVVKGEMLVGTVIAARSFASDLADPLQSIVSNINSIKSVHTILDKTKQLSDKLEEETRQEALPLSAGTIEYKDVSIKIGELTIIDHFSYCFEQGKKYLIVGHNGSGKSTIFKALKKYINGISGEILVNGVAMSQLSNDELAKQVSYSNENVATFTGSVLENIVLFREDCENNIERAVKDSHMNLDLQKIIHDANDNISSGERRKIEIARSLLNPFSVLIFDEVTSTLDIETAYEIERMVLGYKDKTVIFISHNFSGKLIDKYDDILLIDNGRLIDHGKYRDLVKRNNAFKHICEVKFGRVL